MKKQLTRALYKGLKILNFDPQNIYMLRSNHKDTKDGEFKKFFYSDEFKENSLLDYSRAYFIYQMICNLESYGGSIAECGTYRGGVGWLIANVVSNNTLVHLFDTFEGMPNLITQHDAHEAGDLANTSFEHVRTLLADFDNVKIHKGLFSEKFKDSTFGDVI